MDIRSLLEQQLGSAKRTDALKPLAWIFGLLVTCLIGMIFSGAGAFMQWFIAALLLMCFMLYGGAYIYLLYRDPDALRSEHYAIQKLAIEKRVYGDNEYGMQVGDKPSYDKLDRGRLSDASDVEEEGSD